jgi:S-adenosylmethionine:tRNA ribosyltransferase-isomerase
MMIDINDFDYQLPDGLIASKPAEPRDSSRLLVYKKNDGIIQHHTFNEIGQFLKGGDLLVVNNSKVFPARLLGQKVSGGKIEILLLEQSNQVWSAMIGGKVSVDQKIIFSEKLSGIIVGKDGKTGIVKFDLSGDDFWREIEKIGHTPIPPYISKNVKIREDYYRKKYQTVYAEKVGSAAAPTAGLHFTKELISKLRKSDIDFASVDLHVGLGTFAPITEEDIKNKKLHREHCTISKETINKILETKKNGGRVIAVGTTTVRALESFFQDHDIQGSNLRIRTDENNETMEQPNNDYFGSTEIFIQPGFEFKVIDDLVTNFHLPKSSLMMLVAAFLEYKGEKSGREKLLDLYRNAIENNYRFYSFGDAMLIL